MLHFINVISLSTLFNCGNIAYHFDALHYSSGLILQQNVPITCGVFKQPVDADLMMIEVFEYLIGEIIAE